MNRKKRLISGEKPPKYVDDFERACLFIRLLNRFFSLFCMRLTQLKTITALCAFSVAQLAAAASVSIHQEGPGSVQVHSESRNYTTIQNGQVSGENVESTEIRQWNADTDQETVRTETRRTNMSTNNTTVQSNFLSSSGSGSSNAVRLASIRARIDARIALIKARIAERRARRLSFHSATNGVMNVLQLQTDVSGWSQSNP